MKFLPTSVLLGLAIFANPIFAGETDNGYKSCYDAAGANGFTNFTKLVDIAGYKSILEDTSYGGVVFIPTDEAFGVALAALGLTIEDLSADVNAIKKILDYHIVVDGRRYTGDLKDNMMLQTRVPE